MTLYKWSQTASSDASADPTINWAEGMSPAGVNDSGRAMMAAVAKYRDDISGAILTAGTSTAYTVSSYQQFDSLAHLDGKQIAFTPHTTNAVGSPNVTLNVDGLGAKTIRADPLNELAGGILVAGTPYIATYNNTQGLFYLNGFFGNPYSIPVGASVDFWGATAPNSSFALMYGQAISRTAYAALFALLGTTYGGGDGSSTFNIPDLRGRVVAGKDDMGGVAASRLTSGYFGGIPTNLGSPGGSQAHALALSELPTGITSNGAAGVSPNGTGAPWAMPFSNRASGPEFSFDSYGGGSSTPTVRGNANNTLQVATFFSGTAAVTSNNTGGAAHSIVPPTIIGNKLLRII